MAAGEPQYQLAAEARARVEIDRQLAACGWLVQSMGQHNVTAAPGVAVREVTLNKGHGRADYVLFVNGRACGVIEAKPAGTTLTEVERQSAKYTAGLPDWIPAWVNPLPFAYESTGIETRFTCGMDPEPRSRRVFTFHRPETLAAWCERKEAGESPVTVTDGYLHLPADPPTDLWPPKDVAIRNLEHSLREYRPRALIQMATGSGKTLLAAAVAYRLIRYANARRILFLVDRGNLGRQTLKEFQQYRTPDDGRKFTELYNVQHLPGPTIDPAARVTISTIQRLYAVLRGEDLPAELDESTGFDVEPARTVEVEYNSQLPIETFDVIIVDECHRSIYGVWRQVLEYFDANLIGLTATPSKVTFGFFNQNLVMEYGHEQAVADGVNVDFDVYRIRTKITEGGSTVEAGTQVKFRDRETRAERFEITDEDLSYKGTQLGTDVIGKDQMRTVIKTFRQKLFTEIFPGRTEVPKTLIFAKTDTHADEIVQIVREEFGKGNEFAEKITYRTEPGKNPETLLKAFRNSYHPRIAVTVDMIATGTDVKPLECVFFMRTVKSRNYFEQMKGRGVRVISKTDLQAVTPDATVKDRFVIVDAVGATETELSETQPLDREPTVPFDKLLSRLRMGDRSDSTISSIAGRLARLARALEPTDLAELEQVAGSSISTIVHGLIDALDADRRLEHAQAMTGGAAEPTAAEVLASGQLLIAGAVAPLVHNEPLMELLAETKRKQDQLIDEVSIDELVDTAWSVEAADRARQVAHDFRQYIEDHREELVALQVLYDRPWALRELTYRNIRDLAHAIERTHPSWTPDGLWQIYEAIDESKVKGRPHRVLTNLVSLVRYALEAEDQLVPYPDQVNERFAGWLLQQEQAGRTFTPEQIVWLHRIRDHLATSLHISTDDLNEVGFTEHGGVGKAIQLFGDELDPLLLELEQELVA